MSFLSMPPQTPRGRVLFHEADRAAGEEALARGDLVDDRVRHRHVGRDRHDGAAFDPRCIEALAKVLGLPAEAPGWVADIGGKRAAAPRGAYGRTRPA